MVKKLLSILLNFFVLGTYSQKCFLITDVANSQSLFTYQGNVYDIANYAHPGGQNSISQVIGTSLEPFLQQPRYSFHLTSNRFTNDLQRIFVGVLRDNCLPPIASTLPPVATTLATTVAQVATTLPQVATTLPQVATTLPQVATTLPQVATINCVPQILDLNVSYNQQNLIADYNTNNTCQDTNYIRMSLIQNIGGTRISSVNYIQYGKVDITMKTPKGFNVITSFYLETDVGEMSVIDTNAYNSNLDYNANSKSYDQPVILTENFTKYSLIKNLNYYEWQVNDMTLRVINNTNITNNPSKIKISIWEAPPSIWGGPGIQWNQTQYDLLISNFKVNCSGFNYTNKSLSQIDYNDNISSNSFRLTINMIMSIIVFFLFLVT